MKVGKIKGIEINLHLSVLIIVGLVGYYAANIYYSITGIFSIVDFIIVGIINGLIILGSIVAHELMHSIVSLQYGLNVSSIDLYLFGGVSNIEEEPKTPKSEMKISVVGPGISLLIGAIFLSVYYIPVYLLKIDLPSQLTITLVYSGLTNIILGLFNLIPAFPMDGGRILRAYIWKRRDNLISATETASNIGYYFGWVMVGGGLIELVFLPGLFSGIWLIVLGFFLSSSSRRALQQTIREYKLSKINAKEIQNVPSIEIPHNTTVSEAIRDFFMKYKNDYFPVVKNDEIVGIITINHLKNLPFKKRSNITIEEIMGKISTFPSVNEDQTVKIAFNKLQKQEEEPKFVIVKADGKITGFIGLNEIQSTLRLSELLLKDKI
ncbi:MAG: CBS domain-containing protein [Promethearchaeota archaeon]|nr:MAG: CBS domain-containing protein [Candidatus Lokiarchaeota archaeon]